MRQDPSMRKQSPFSKDMSATDDDVKAASKNIIMQMRKAVSLRGKFPVVFADKKKIKIPADIAQAVQQKYNSFKKPADKEKFQAKVAKSYKDMLRALREKVDIEEDDFKPHKMYDPKTGKEYDANTMADHLKMKKMGYTHDKPDVKEVKEEKTILDRIEEIIKENKNG